MKRAIKAGGLVGAAVLGAVGVASGWWVGGWSGERVAARVTGGCVRVELLYPPAKAMPPAGFEFGTREEKRMGAWEFTWRPRWERVEEGLPGSGRLREVVFPLWMPAAGLFGAAVLVWAREAWRERRRGLPGHCRGCGYNRKRVAPYDACPGCGWGGTIVVGGDDPLAGEVVEGEGGEEVDGRPPVLRVR